MALYMAKIGGSNYTAVVKMGGSPFSHVIKVIKDGKELGRKGLVEKGTGSAEGEIANPGEDAYVVFGHVLLDPSAEVKDHVWFI